MKKDDRYILMLEDDVDDRHITQLFIAEIGYRVAIEFLANANDVLPFLEMCTRTGIQLPSIIILDKNIPAGNSMEALKQIKSHPLFSTIPVIMISGTATVAEVKESYQSGASSFIIKPYNSEQTAKTIGSFVSYWFETVQLPVAGITEGVLS